MRDSFESKVRCHAPADASGYYLVTQRHGKTVRYPPQGAFGLNPFAEPSGAPYGSYLLHFVGAESDSQQDGGTGFVQIQIVPPGQLKDHQRIDGLYQNPGQTASPAGSSRAELNSAIPSPQTLLAARADREKQRMAMELAENNQDILSQGRGSREAAEALALNRAYRRESQLAIDAQTSQTRQTAEDVKEHWAAFLSAQEAQARGMRLLKEQLELFSRPAPPPLPPDYTPAFVEGLKALRDLGVALIQTRTAGATAPKTTTSAPPSDGAKPIDPT